MMLEIGLAVVDLMIVLLMLLRLTLAVRLGKTKACIHGALRVAVEVKAWEVRARSKKKAMAMLARV